jgi:hypothetical protein
MKKILSYAFYLTERLSFNISSDIYSFFRIMSFSVEEKADMSRELIGFDSD